MILYSVTELVTISIPKMIKSKISSSLSLLPRKSNVLLGKLSYCSSIITIINPYSPPSVSFDHFFDLFYAQIIGKFCVLLKYSVSFPIFGPSRIFSICTEPSSLFLIHHPNMWWFLFQPWHRYQFFLESFFHCFSLGWVQFLCVPIETCGSSIYLCRSLCLSFTSPWA